MHSKKRGTSRRRVLLRIGPPRGFGETAHQETHLQFFVHLPNQFMPSRRASRRASRRGSRRASRRASRRRRSGRAHTTQRRYRGKDTQVRRFLEQDVIFHTELHNGANDYLVKKDDQISLDSFDTSFKVGKKHVSIRTHEPPVLFGEWPGNHSNALHTTLNWGHTYTVQPAPEPPGKLYTGLSKSTSLEEFQEYPFSILTLRVKMEMTFSTSPDAKVLNEAIRNAKKLVQGHIEPKNGMFVQDVYKTPSGAKKTERRSKRIFTLFRPSTASS